MFKPTPQQLKEILANHKLWLDGKLGGVRAYLRNADLQYANLHGANLYFANLRNADMRNADMRNADMRNADMRNADMRNADMPHNNWLIGAKFHQLSGIAYEFEGKQKYVVWGVQIT